MNIDNSSGISLRHIRALYMIIHHCINLYTYNHIHRYNYMVYTCHKYMYINWHSYIWCNRYTYEYERLGTYRAHIGMTVLRDGNFWVVVNVKSWVKELTWLLIGSLFSGSQSGARLALWPNSWHWLPLKRFHPCTLTLPRTMLKLSMYCDIYIQVCIQDFGQRANNWLLIGSLFSGAANQGWKLLSCSQCQDQLGQRANLAPDWLQGSKQLIRSLFMTKLLPWPQFQSFHHMKLPK